MYVKSDTNELIYKTKRDAHIENKFMVTEREWRGGLKKGKVKMFLLLYKVCSMLLSD